MTDLLSKAATAAEIARAVGSGKVKASAIIAAALKRIEAAEPTVNAFTDIVADRAKRRAIQIDAGQHRGPLSGVPFAVKNCRRARDRRLTSMARRRCATARWCANSKRPAQSSWAASTWANTPTTSPARTRTTVPRAIRTIPRA
jgi:hypothetical protein